MIGIGGLWLGFFLWQLEKMPLLPLHMPLLAEENTSMAEADDLKYETKISAPAAIRWFTAGLAVLTVTVLISMGGFYGL